MVKPDENQVMQASFSAVIGRDALSSFFAKLDESSFPSVQRRYREYRQRTRFNFLNSVTVNEK